MKIKHCKKYILYFLILFSLILLGRYCIYIGFFDLFAAIEAKGTAILGESKNGVYYIDELNEFNILESLSGYIVIALLLILLVVKSLRKYILNKYFTISVFLNFFIFYFGIADYVKLFFLHILHRCGFLFMGSVVFLSSLFLVIIIICLIVLKRVFATVDNVIERV